MLDLDTGVDLDEVVASLLVKQELGGTSVACVAPCELVVWGPLGEFGRSNLR